MGKRVKVGYIYNSFEQAVERIQEGRFNWMIVELATHSYLYLILRTGDSHYISRLSDWQEYHDFVYLGYQCFYKERNTSFRHLVGDLTRVGGGLDIGIKLLYGTAREPYQVEIKLDQGCAIVFLKQGTLVDKICLRSKKLKDILSFLKYSPAYLPGVSATCFDAGGDRLEQVIEKIEQVVRSRSESLTRSRTNGFRF